MTENFRSLLEGRRDNSRFNRSSGKKAQNFNFNAAMAAGKGKRLQLERDGRMLEYILKYKGRWVIDTTHGSQRIVERGQLSMRELETLFKRMVKKFMSLGPKYTGQSNVEYFFFSKSLNQGIIVAYNKDFRNIDSKDHFIIKTFFPKGSTQTWKETEHIILESTDFGQKYSDACLEYLSCMRENFSEGVHPSLAEGTYIPERIKVDSCEFDMIFCDGKLFSLSDFDVIEIN